jgi:hypothetical protein
MLFVALVFGQAIGATALGFIVTTASFSTAFVAASAVSGDGDGDRKRGAEQGGAPQGPTG